VLWDLPFLNIVGRTINVVGRTINVLGL